MLIIDPLKSFNDVIEYYREMLNLTSKLFIGMPSQAFSKECFSLAQSNHYISSVQSIIFNKSLRLQMAEELIAGK